MRIELPARQPFSLAAVISSHGWARLAPFSLSSDGEVLHYILSLNSGQVVQLQIKPAENGVWVDLEDMVSVEEQKIISGSVNWMLGLDQDFSDFYKLAEREPRLNHVIDNAQGRLLRSPTLFEDTIKTILTTNTAWSGTIRMTQAVVDQFGHVLEADPSKRAFPSPTQIAASDEHTLRSETRLGYRSPYILNLAQEIESGDIDLEELTTAEIPTEELQKKLLAIKGVGNYAAANLLMLLGHYSYLAIDSWALKMVSHEWYQGEQIGPRISLLVVGLVL
jgi:3-methyladenine DNA glycosylase/8-oxoguanine DNA glycosylase